MRIFCAVVAVIAGLLLLMGLGGTLWTAADLMDNGRCDDCSFRSMDTWSELAAAVALNIVMYGGALALAVWGYRRAKPPSDPNGTA